MGCRVSYASRAGQGGSAGQGKEANRAGQGWEEQRRAGRQADAETVIDTSAKDNANWFDSTVFLFSFIMYHTIPFLIFFAYKRHFYLSST